MTCSTCAAQWSRASRFSRSNEYFTYTAPVTVPLVTLMWSSARLIVCGLMPREAIPVATVRRRSCNAEALAVRCKLTHRQVEREHCAVFAPAAHLPPDPDDLLDASAEIVGEVAIVLRAIGLWHQNLDVFTDEFGSLVAKHPSGCGIRVLNGPSRIDDDDGRRGRLEKTLELRGLGLNGLTCCIGHAGVRWALYETVQYQMRLVRGNNRTPDRQLFHRATMVT